MNTLSVRRFLLFNVVLLLSAIAIVGQRCPTIKASGPTENSLGGQPITFGADVRGEDPKYPPTYNWTLSAGVITSGQGTSAITAEPMGDDVRSITATVAIGGFPPRCRNSASVTTSIRSSSKPQLPIKIDDYGAIRLADEHARLDEYAIALDNDPTSRAYIITYGGRKSAPGAAKTASKRVFDYLVMKRGVEISRIVRIDGGSRELPFTELWVVPRDARPPAASPTIQKRR